jgi:hypothetical protein
MLYSGMTCPLRRSFGISVIVWQDVGEHWRNQGPPRQLSSFRGSGGAAALYDAVAIPLPGWMPEGSRKNRGGPSNEEPKLGRQGTGRRGLFSPLFTLTYFSGFRIFNTFKCDFLSCLFDHSERVFSRLET